MNFESKNTEINSSEVLMQIAKRMEAPLASIMKANEKYSKLSAKESLPQGTNEIIFSSSQEIASLIEEVVNMASGNKPIERVPLIYQIYYSNERVKSICKDAINPKKISKQDSEWLVKMEDEINKSIKQKDLNLYDLSYKMAVSERQLHRKIKSLLHLTPNKYIRVLRLHKAKEFIDDYLYDTISQVSYAVGYYDTYYFSKLFRQQYDIYPKDLLNQRRY